jgi:hypothetical protein
MKMNKKIAITKVLVAIFAITTLAAVISQSFSAEAPNQSRYMPQYTATGEMILPPNNIWRDWVFVGSPLTPNALNGGKAGFPGISQRLHPTVGIRGIQENECIP